MSRHENYVPNLGQLCGDDARRDAIHIAVAPLVAGVILEPGQHVGLFHDGTASPMKPHIGVVDPFLKEPVPAGESFWVMLYPGTITGLRHVWTHPAFKPRIPEVKS
jgi:hypothetical protein